MERSKRFLLNSACTAIMQISVILCGFILNRIILTSYSAETSGFIMSIIQYSSYFVMLTGGIAGAVIFALYAPLADNDHVAVNGILTKARQVFFYAGLIVLPINLLIAFIYPIFIDADISAWSMRLIILVMSIFVFTEMVIIPCYNTLFTADQRTYFYSLISAFSYIIQLLTVYLISKTDGSAIFVCISYLSASLIRSIAVIWYVRYKYPKINYKGIPLSGWMRLQKYVLYIQIIGLLQTTLPLIFTTLYTDLATVRVFATYNLIVMGVMSVLSIFVTNITPAFGDVIARNEKQVLTGAYHKYEITFFAFTALVGSAAVLAITDVIRLYTQGIEKAGFENAEIGLLFILNIVLISLQVPQTSILQAKGMYKEMRTPATVHILIFILPAVILAPSLGMEGILIASVIGNIYRSVRLVFFLPSIIENYKIKKSLIRQGITIFSVILSYFIYKLTGYHIDSLVSLIIYTLIMTILVGIIILALFFITDRHEFTDTIKEIRLLIINRKS
ncbi:MAG: hypothetical protein FWC09_00930 [Lachnospiraceae bacterium]|nr:hypothetical protein [Lachnospiraceae bacterium]